MLNDQKEKLLDKQKIPNQPNQTQIQIMIERGPDVCSENTSQTRFSRDCKNVILEEEANHDRTVRPVVCSQSVSSSSMLNEEIDMNSQYLDCHILL